MSINNLESCEPWNSKFPKTPKRSKLYSLEPVSISTAYTEGLISYVCRLAEAHCVSPGVLIKQEILPSFRRNYTVGNQEIYQLHNNGGITTVACLPKPANTKNSNEYGFLAFQYIKGLEPLVLREDLQSLIIPPWIGEALGTDIELARDVRAWCPKCFQDSLDIKKPIYEPLLWSITAVTVCPYHHQPLQSRCPFCKKNQRPLTGKMQVGRCSQCKAWLNKLGENSSESESSVYAELEWHLWVTKQVMGVLAVTPNLPYKETSAAIAQVLRDTKRPESEISVNPSTRRIQLKLLETIACYVQ
ncbi:TniQ family protein [Kovacikia minuta CCNUW1]|uniref:TniQ family protein n=1 Tax=Kovacikia minuta TaxID=2931930 RepID=UPI001CCAA50E|nr:TniQ family protein [Kovacikia minuta]UBF28557.1 TniQ family protein [Kovacikia minuta CCNUW1]